MKRFQLTHQGVKIIYSITTLFLIGLSIFIYSLINQLINTAYVINENSKVSSELDKMMDNLRDAQSAQREYLATHDSSYLAALNSSLNQYPIHLKQAEYLLPDSDFKRQQFSKIRQLADKRKDYFLNIQYIDRRRPVTLADTRPGALLADTLRFQVTKFKSLDDHVVKQRNRLLEYHSTFTPSVFLILALISLTLLLYFYLQINKSFHRTSQLQEEMNLKNEELKKINAELESFTYIASHDLQEPVRKIMVLSDFLLKSEQNKLSEQGKAHLEKLHSSTARIRRLIDDILAFSQISVQQKVYEHVELSQVIEQVTADLADSIDAKQGSVNLSSSRSIKIIRSQFHQLFINLISNSLKFSKADALPLIAISISELPRRKITSASHLPDNIKQVMLESGFDYDNISVEDNGIGFDPMYSEQIFKMFAKLHNRTQYAGTGIGLAFVKKIVENHNGYIIANSSPGNGCRFDIYIPK